MSDYTTNSLLNFYFKSSSTMKNVGMAAGLGGLAAMAGSAVSSLAGGGGGHKSGGGHAPGSSGNV